MSESIAAFFTGIGLLVIALNLSGLTPKQINEEWEKKLVQKGLGEYVVETIHDKPVIKFQFKDK